jgi:NADP-dependent 3-hydroxy acid dehydrogenase YdfG
MNMSMRVQEKYGKDVVVIAGATTGLGLSYAMYFIELGFSKIVLIDADYDKLQVMRE